MDAGFAFYDRNKIVFASDCPFDPEGGTMYIRETIRLLDEMKLPKAERDLIDHGHLEKLVGKTFAK
jgi:hypothetical protein